MTQVSGKHREMARAWLEKNIAAFPSQFDPEGDKRLIESLAQAFASVEGEAMERTRATLRDVGEYLAELTGKMNAASCKTQDCESAPWEELVHADCFNGTMASYRQQIDEAIRSDGERK